MGTISQVIEHLKGWKPIDCKNELQYHASLETLLRSKFPGAHIEREFRHNGTTVDLLLNNQALMGKTSVFIEVKRDLIKKGEYDRLVGQVIAIGPKGWNIMVILCGRTDPKYVGRFVETFKEFMNDDPLNFLGQQRTVWLVVMNELKA